MYTTQWCGGEIGQVYRGVGAYNSIVGSEEEVSVYNSIVGSEEGGWCVQLYFFKIKTTQLIVGSRGGGGKEGGIGVYKCRRGNSDEHVAAHAQSYEKTAFAVSPRTLAM